MSATSITRWAVSHLCVLALIKWTHAKHHTCTYMCVRAPHSSHTELRHWHRRPCACKHAFWEHFKCICKHWSPLCLNVCESWDPDRPRPISDPADPPVSVFARHSTRQSDSGCLTVSVSLPFHCYCYYILCPCISRERPISSLSLDCILLLC